MNRNEIQSAIYTALGEIAPEIEGAKLKADRPLREQAEIDSFDFLNFLIRLHELTGVEIPETAYADVESIDALANYIATQKH